jgi:hypothetical protein
MDSSIDLGDYLTSLDCSCLVDLVLERADADDLWWVLGQRAADRGMAFVCVQTLLTSWARRGEDLIFDKTIRKTLSSLRG